MSKNTWIIFIAIVVLLFGGLIVWSRANSPTIDVSGLNENSVLGASDANGNIADHAKGNTSSPVVLVEYGDFQCPGCASAHAGLKSIATDYSEDIAFVFRHLPLTTIHPNARAASAAAEAAGIQGKFWEMHDYLFTSQDQWKNLDATARTDAFVRYAQSLNLDTDKFRTDLSSQAISQKINFDLALSKKANAESTPTIILNGVKLTSEQVTNIQTGTGDLVRALIDSKLKEAANK